MESKLNNTRQFLGVDETWVGLPEVTTNFANIAVNIVSTQNLSVIVYQSLDGRIFDFQDNYIFDTTLVGTQTTFQVAVKALFVKVSVINVSVNDINNLVITTVFINTSRDSSILQPDVIAGSVDVLNGIKATDYEFNTLRDVACDDTGRLLVTTNNVTVQGQNNNFEFFPTPTNNTSTVYADGTAGINVAGGWSYSNLITGKINWYCYASPGVSTDYKVSQLNSMYTVVNNKSTLGLALAQNPWIMIYTRPDSGTNGAAWYKSKLFFGSNAFTDVQGIKLLYTGADSVNIHPEITGSNRIQLLFVEALSTKPLLDALNENIMLGSLQTTNNTTQAGAFNFVMEEFGADWVKSPSILPIEFNKVQADVTGTVTSLHPTLITQTQVITSPTASLTSSSFDLGNNSLFDCLLLATGTIVTGNVRLDYSIDNTNWFPDNSNNASLSTADPHFVYHGVSTASRYVRLSSGTVSTFSATTLSITFSSKLN